MIHKIRSIFLRTLNDFRRMSFLEGLTTAVAAIEPLFSIPQLYLNYSTRSAEDLSIITSYFGVAAGIIWLVYGVNKKNIPIIVSSSMWLVVEILLLNAIILYG